MFYSAEPAPVSLETDESSFEVVEMSGKGQGMVAKRSVLYLRLEYPIMTTIQYSGNCIPEKSS